MSRVPEPKSTPLSLPRDVRMGEVEQRLARRRTQVTVEASNRRPLRVAAAAPAGSAAAAQRGNADRTARMRAVEQAWKEERARQIAREAKSS